MNYIIGIFTGLLIFDIFLNINKLIQKYKYNKFIEDSINFYQNQYGKYEIDNKYREELMRK